jgi:hypothetical protein
MGDLAAVQIRVRNTDWRCTPARERLGNPLGFLQRLRRRCSSLSPRTPAGMPSGGRRVRGRDRRISRRGPDPAARIPAPIAGAANPRALRWGLLPPTNLVRKHRRARAPPPPVDRRRQCRDQQARPSRRLRFRSIIEKWVDEKVWSNRDLLGGAAQRMRGSFERGCQRRTKPRRRVLRGAEHKCRAGKPLASAGLRRKVIPLGTRRLHNKVHGLIKGVPVACD